MSRAALRMTSANALRNSISADLAPIDTAGGIPRQGLPFSVVRHCCVGTELAALCLRSTTGKDARTMQLTDMPMTRARRAINHGLTAATLAGLLLAAIGQAQAATLYRWLEPDGTPTFSPKPPPAGIEYTEVDTAKLSSAASNGAAPAPAAPAIVTAAPRAQAQEKTDTLSYAPSPARSAQDLGSGLSAATASATASDNAPVDEATNAPAVTASNTKLARCRELEKRVISLERRLRSPLTPEDMDNTVLYMAQYQQNVDRHCRT